MAEERPHPLKNKWFVWYFPHVDEATDEKDYDELQTPQELGFVTTIEEVWATINALPPVTQWPANDNLVFAREKKDPYYESFPKGSRISIFTRTAMQGELALSVVLGAVLGESIRRITGDLTVADVVRVSHKPGKAAADSMRLEVWLRDDTYNDAFTSYLKGEIMKKFPNTQFLVGSMMPK